MSKKSLHNYYTKANGKIKTLSGKYEFTAKAWNAYAELLALREYAADCRKNSDWRLYEKMYNRLVNSDRFGLAIYVEQQMLRNKEVH